MKPKEIRKTVFWMVQANEDWMLDSENPVVRRFVRFIDRPGWDWMFGEWVNRLVCLVYGHESIADQCNMPAHDYCWSCRTLTPGRAPRGSKP